MNLIEEFLLHTRKNAAHSDTQKREKARSECEELRKESNDFSIQFQLFPTPNDHKTPKPSRVEREGLK